jgi:hypothetical protein
VIRFGSIFYSRKKTKFCTCNKIALPFGADLRNLKKIRKRQFWGSELVFQFSGNVPDFL